MAIWRTCSSSRAPLRSPGRVREGFRRHLPRHDHPRLRHGPLLPGRHRRGARLRPDFNEEIKEAGDFDAAVVTLKNAAGVVATIVNNRKCSAGYASAWRPGSTGTLNADNIRATTCAYPNAEVTGCGRAVPGLLPAALRRRLPPGADQLHRRHQRWHQAPARHQGRHRGPTPSRGRHRVCGHRQGCPPVSLTRLISWEH